MDGFPMHSLFFDPREEIPCADFFISQENASDETKTLRVDAHSREEESCRR